MRLTNRDLPPRGGFAPIRYKRNMPVRGPSGVFLIFATIGVSAFGFFRIGQTNIEKRCVPTRRACADVPASSRASVLGAVFI